MSGTRDEPREKGSCIMYHCAAGFEILTKASQVNWDALQEDTSRLINGIRKVNCTVWR